MKCKIKKILRLLLWFLLFTCVWFLINDVVNIIFFYSKLVLLWVILNSWDVFWCFTLALRLSILDFMLFGHEFLVNHFKTLVYDQRFRESMIARRLSRFSKHLYFISMYIFAFCSWKVDPRNRVVLYQTRKTHSESVLDKSKRCCSKYNHCI